MGRARATALKRLSEPVQPKANAPALAPLPPEDDAEEANEALAPVAELDAHALLDLEAVTEAQMLAAFPGSFGRAGRLTLMLQRFVLDVKAVDESAWGQMARVLERLARPPVPRLPEVAPERWHERDRSERTTPVAFARRVYGAWLGRGLTRQHLNRLDPDLYRAVSVWETRHPGDRLTELPTLEEAIDARIASLAGEFSEEELRKLGSTLQTRHRRKKKMIA